VTYTRLRLTEDGIVLCAYHLRRLGLSEPEVAVAPPGQGTVGDGRADTVLPALDRFARFARTSRPGVWAVWVDAAGNVRAEPAGESALRDGLPVRSAPSPLVGIRGPVPKPASPSPYDAVRREGAATVLVSGDGREIYEACRAAVVGWDGERIVCVPPDRPRVWSTAESAVRDHLAVREAPLLVAADTPLLLVNAVAGTCAVEVPGRMAFPTRARETIDDLFARLTAWPVAREDPDPPVARD
jgi:hypothetical protein